ncbi:MAG: hypothetical protein RLZZ253_1042 [Verrucomicrobiota bacterium]|jgi:uncharacterized membrane protein YqjE
MAESTPGLTQNLTAFGAALARHLGTRLELFSLESREAGAQWAALALLLGATALCIAIGYLFLCLAAVFLVGTALGGGTAWAWVCGGTGLLHGAGAAFLGRKIRALSARPIFEATMAEFRKDSVWLSQTPEKRN